MRLAYNYTKQDFAYYSPDSESLVLFTAIQDADDDDEVIEPLISNGDTFVIYDVSAWDAYDLEYFGLLQEEGRHSFMKELKVIREGIYGVIGIQR